METWNTQAQLATLTRALAVARRLGDDHCGVEHVLAALTKAPASTPASRALSPATPAVTNRPSDDAAHRAEAMVAVTPQLQQVLAMAAGMALHAGVSTVTDELVLLAVSFHAPETLEPLGLTAGAVVAALATEGIEVPDVEPPPPGLPVSWGPAVYVVEDDWPAVQGMIAQHLAPQRVPVAFNVSTWQPGRLYVLAEEGTELDSLIRGAVSDPSRVSVVAYEEAMTHESNSS